MRINELVNGLGEFFQATFKILTKLGNIPNSFFIALGFVLLFFWVNKMANYNKEAAQNGSLK